MNPLTVGSDDAEETGKAAEKLVASLQKLTRQLKLVGVPIRLTAYHLVEAQLQIDRLQNLKDHFHPNSKRKQLIIDEFRTVVSNVLERLRIVDPKYAGTDEMKRSFIHLRENMISTWSNWLGTVSLPKTVRKQATLKLRALLDGDIMPDTYKPLQLLLDALLSGTAKENLIFKKNSSRKFAPLLRKYVQDKKFEHVRNIFSPSPELKKHGMPSHLKRQIQSFGVKGGKSNLQISSQVKLNVDRLEPVTTKAEPTIEETSLVIGNKHSQNDSAGLEITDNLPAILNSRMKTAGIPDSQRLRIMGDILSQMTGDGWTAYSKAESIFVHGILAGCDRRKMMMQCTTPEQYWELVVFLDYIDLDGLVLGTDEKASSSRMSTRSEDACYNDTAYTTRFVGTKHDTETSKSFEQDSAFGGRIKTVEEQDVFHDCSEYPNQEDCDNDGDTVVLSDYPLERADQVRHFGGRGPGLISTGMLDTPETIWD